MSSDAPGDPRTVAIEALGDLGLSTYATRTFAALAGLGVGTASDVSEVSDVPRTRVYDAIDDPDADPRRVEGGHRLSLLE